MLIPAQSAPAPPFSSLRSLSSHYFLLPSHVHFLPPLRRGDLAIRMGGGPRTYPGGVSKWQWKRMQAKKARQLLKARLARERQLYEMRKRTELRDAVAHLERPWDPDSSADASALAPNLLSVAAEDQLRALADRFHRPGGVDLWNDRDGPRVFASPATGAASARFFPRNAFHSIQPYALVNASGEASAQGVRENAEEDEAHSSITTDREPAVQLTERDDGTWEPVNGLGDADDSTADESTSEDDGEDGDAISESEGLGDVGSWSEQRAMVRRNGRSNGVARWQAAGAMAAGNDNDSNRGWSGDAFFSDSERRGHREQRWQERSGNASPRKQQAGGRWTGLKTTVGSHVRQRSRTGAGSFSESEVIRGASEPKWRASKGKRDDTRNGSGRWNAPEKDYPGDWFDSNPGSARGGELEPRRGARNKMNGSDNVRGRSKPNYSRNANGGEKLLKFMSGDSYANSNNGFAEDLEAPKWKPRRMNRARNNNGGRDDDMGGRFRRGVDGGAAGAGRLRANPMNNRDNYSVDGGRANPMNNRDNYSVDGGRKKSRNGGRRLRGDEYSLRPTSELRGSWPDTGSDGL